MTAEATRQTANKAPRKSDSTSNREFALGMLRAAGGAILFSVPMLMTMEMWALGFYVNPLRLVIFILLDVPLLIGVSYYAGFEETSGFPRDVLDAFAALAVGAVISTVLLLIFTVIEPGMSADEIVGKIAIQSVPASLGAVLSRSQFFAGERTEERRRSASFGAGLFLTVVGSLYLAASVASTIEVVLLSYKMSPWHILALMVFSLAVMHALELGAVAQEKSQASKHDIPFGTVFTRITVVDYSLCLLVSLFMLWTFGRTDGMALPQVLEAVVVLGFPASIGGGAARMII